MGHISDQLLLTNLINTNNQEYWKCQVGGCKHVASVLLLPSPSYPSPTSKKHFSIFSFLKASEKMQQELAVLEGSGSSKDVFKPKGASKKKNSEESAKPTKPAPPFGTELPQSEAAKDARLRRLCERKPSGRLQVPESLHLRWKSASREEKDQMVDILDSVGWNKDTPLLLLGSIQIQSNTSQLYDSL